MTNLIHFTYPPAFGTETETRNSAPKVNDNSLDFEVRGQRKPRKDEDVRAEEDWNTANLVKKRGYFPLLGTLVGMYRIYKAITNTDLPNKWNHIARGCIELTSC